MNVKAIVASSVVALATVASAGLVLAQQQGPGSGMMEEKMGPGIMAPGMMGPGGMMAPGMGMMRGGQGMMGRMGTMGGGMGGCSMGGMMGVMGMMGAMMDEEAMPPFAEGRIAFLKAELGITDAQKKAWDTLAESMKKNLESIAGVRQDAMKIWEAKTLTDRVDAHIALLEGRLKVLKEVKPALAAFYNSLSEDQKKKAETLLTSMGCMS